MRSATSSRNALRLRLLQAAGRLPIGASKPHREAKRVLLIRPDHIGDVLLGAEAVALLRASLPDAHLTYLVGPWSKAAAEAGPSVDEVRTLDYPGFTRRRKANLVEPYALLARQAAALRHERFDCAVVLRPDHWWGALLALLAGIPLRAGTATAETAPLLTHSCEELDEHASQHAVRVAHVVLEAIGATPARPSGVRQFTVTTQAHETARRLWVEHGLEDKRVIGLHPSAGAPLKSWPVARWAALADCLTAQGAVVLIGAPEDRALLDSIRQRMRNPAPALCGQSLQVSAALYARCSLLVSVDSGAGHVAAAVGAPTVRLYGPAPPGRFGPWPPRPDQHVLLSSTLACAPCGRLEAPPCGARSTPACMLALGVDEVVKAVRAELHEG